MKILRKIARAIRRAITPLAVSVALCVSALSFQLPAFSQVTPSTVFQLTNLPAVVTGGATSNLFNGTGGTSNYNVISLSQGAGLAFGWLIAGTNSLNPTLTTSCTMNWVGSFDGTNWFTNTPFPITLTNTTGAANLEETNVIGQYLNNLNYIAPWNIVNNSTGATNRMFLSNIWVSRGNILPVY